VNAVVDAVSHLGVTDVPKPATPEAVWRAIRSAHAGNGQGGGA
jgi:carbon-monoxide dehydrogenase large subunit